MKWIDYREKLGIGIKSEEKFKMLLNKTCSFIKARIAHHYDFHSYINYCLMVCEERSIGEPANELCVSFKKSKTMEELISKYIAFLNTFEGDTKQKIYEQAAEYFILKSLEDLNIEFDIIVDNDGKFIFPKGAKELDNALVSEPLEWLNKYPNARKEWVEALKDYSNMSKTNPSDVADKFRKALERFFQDFFKSTKSLENLKSEYGTYVKSKGVPTEISGNFETVLQSYSNFMNNYAKHHNKTSENVLEYIMYQTGNIIRLLITLENNY